MFMFVLSFYLYSMAVKDCCSTLTVECKTSDNRTMHLNYILTQTTNATRNEAEFDRSRFSMRTKMTNISKIKSQ